MPASPFISDLWAIPAAFLIFSVVAFFPGYGLGWLTNVLRFRQRTAAFRLAASAPLALAAGPILAFTVGRWFSLNAVLGIYALLTGYALYLGIRDIRRGSFRLPLRKLAPFAGLAAVWLGIALGSLTDLQIGKRLYFSIIAFDYAIRIEFTQAISSFGIPAHRALFKANGSPAVLCIERVKNW